MSEIVRTELLPKIVEDELLRAGTNSSRIKVAINTTRGHSDVDFVLCFHSNLLTLMVQYDLSAAELRVLMALLQAVAYGGLVSVPRKTLESATKLAGGTVSRALRRLREARLLTRSEDGSEHLNLAVVHKGRLSDLSYGGSHRARYVESWAELRFVPGVRPPKAIPDDELQ